MTQELYNALCSQLKLVNGIKTIDLWDDQFYQEEEQRAYNFPAVFIDFESVDWQGTGFQNQQGDITIAMHVGWRSYSFSDPDSPEKENVLDVFDFLSAIQAKMQGFQGTGFTGLVRMQTLRDKNSASVMHFIVRYKSKLHDAVAVPEITTTSNKGLTTQTGTPTTTPGSTFDVS